MIVNYKFLLSLNNLLLAGTGTIMIFAVSVPVWFFKNKNIDSDFDFGSLNI